MGLRVDMLICTKGLVGVVRKLLQDLRLLHFFEDVFGNIGSGYGETESPYDQGTEPPQSHGLLGELAQAQWNTKKSLIHSLLKRRQLLKEECCLVEDDPDEISDAQDTCRTVFVEAQKGMVPAHFEALQSMIRIGGNTNGESLPAAQSSAAV